MSDTTTDGIRVQVKPTFWAEQSAPEHGRFAFTYTITISNVGNQRARLRTRHWIITDAEGHVEEVRGEGVVGKHPDLEPGQSFEYTSWAALKTPFGSMRGSYFFERPDGTRFEAKIAEFPLVQPHALH
jgi:ApaG protein